VTQEGDPLPQRDLNSGQPLDLAGGSDIITPTPQRGNGMTVAQLRHELARVIAKEAIRKAERTAR
jgi:hypothetical protein